MFRAVFKRGDKLLREVVVFLGCFTAFDGSRDGMGDDAAVFGLDEEFWGCADELEVCAVDVEEVGTRVDGAEVTVDVEWVEGGRTGEALRWDGLDYVAFYDVCFEGFDVVFVPGLPDVGDVLLVFDDGGLWGEWDVPGLEGFADFGDGGAGGGVEGMEGGFGEGPVGDVEVGYYFDCLEEVVEGDDGVAEHEEGFWGFEDVFEGARGAGFKVFHAVVGDVADCAPGHGGKVDAWEFGDTVLGEFFFELGEGVDFGAMARTGLDDSAGVWEEVLVGEEERREEEEEGYRIRGNCSDRLFPGLRRSRRGMIVWFYSWQS